MDVENRLPQKYIALMGNAAPAREARAVYKNHYRMIITALSAALLISILGAGWAVQAVNARADIELASAEIKAAEIAAQVDELEARDLLPEGMEAQYIGNFRCTSYCTERYSHICGTGDGITASGAPVTADLTIAVDPDIIPLGSVVYIAGVGVRVAQDVGGAVQGYHIDVAVPGTHEDALSWAGYGYHDVWILGG